MFDIASVPAAPKVLMLSSHDEIAGTVASQLCAQGFVVRLEDPDSNDVRGADVILIDQLDGASQWTIDPATLVQPVLVIGAGSSTDICDAFARGVVDYITPPPRMRELASRIRAALRRSAYEQRGRHAAGPAADEQQVTPAWPGEHEMNLSENEERILMLLAANSGHVVTRSELARRIWGVEVDPRLIADQMRRLRAKLGRLEDCPIEITLVRGVGYRVSST